LWIGLAGGGAAAALFLLTRNSPPIAGTISASPPTALQGGTTVTLTSQGASDPDGDPLTYSWNFGDGSSGSGQSVTKVYSTSGTMNVELTVSDGKKSATATTTVTVRSLTGTWRGSHPFYGLTTIVLNQSGTTFSGSWTDPFGPGTVTGNVTTTAPNVRLTVNFPGFNPGQWNATPNSDVTSLTGTYTEPGVSGTFTVTRQ
jgi:PKD repeat protein